jgi:hypothetical protein
MDGAPQLTPPPKLGGGAPPLPPGAAGGAGSMTGPGPGGPMSSPMATPQPMEGMQKGARMQIQVASQMLQRELAHFPLESPEFKALDDALRNLQKAFGKNKEDDRKAFPSEIMNMLAAVGPGSATPGQQAMMKPPGAGAPPPAAPPQLG